MVTGQRTPRWGMCMRSLDKKKRILILAITIVFLAIVVGLIFFFVRRNRSAVSEQQTSTAPPSEIVQKVGQLIELPSDEEPSVAIVKDVEKLKDQEIFRKAKNGNYLLIYVKARRAYLYDNERHILVDVAPVSLTNNGIPEALPSPRATPSSVPALPTATPTTPASSPEAE